MEEKNKLFGAAVEAVEHVADPKPPAQKGRENRESARNRPVSSVYSRMERAPLSSRRTRGVALQRVNCSWNGANRAERFTGDTDPGCELARVVCAAGAAVPVAAYPVAAGVGVQHVRPGIDPVVACARPIGQRRCRRCGRRCRGHGLAIAGSEAPK